MRSELTEDDCRDAVAVLETALGPRGYSDAVEAERKWIVDRYRELRAADPGKTFTLCSLTARAEWLRAWVEGRVGDGE